MNNFLSAEHYLCEIEHNVSFPNNPKHCGYIKGLYFLTKDTFNLCNHAKRVDKRIYFINKRTKNIIYKQENKNVLHEFEIKDYTFKGKKLI